MLTLVRKLWSTILRTALVLFGLVVVAVVMVVGAVLGVALISWALLRGRSAPPLAFRWNGPVDWRRGGRRQAGDAPADADVVDIEARELAGEAPSAASEPPRLDDRHLS
ncbi:MAG: hypothetical protein ABI564_00745 [Ideonella sp.]